MVRVKICGVKRLKDARLVFESGADAIGVLVGQHHASDDFLRPSDASSLVKSLPPFISPVLVTHIEEPEDVVRLAKHTLVSTVQVHSSMELAGIEKIRQQLPWLKIIKTIHVTGEESIDSFYRYEDLVNGFLLDSINLTTNQVGGTGKTHDWTVSAEIVRRCKRPVILAGGLTPENVVEAVRVVSPFGVDVNSGTKGPDGFKDPVKVREFVLRAKQG